MTREQVNLMMESIGLPYAYYQFTRETRKAPPFICFFYTGGNDVIADNSNYQSIERLRVELYADNKDFESEALIEDALVKNKLVWDKDETFIDSEKLFMTVYESEVVINEQK